MKKLKFNQILLKITESVKNAKIRICATHLLEKDEDFLLPEEYIKSLNETVCNNRKRIVFGNQDLFEKFKIQDEYFTNFFSEQDYIRMILVDNEVFFRVDENFYNSSEENIVNILDEYYIKTFNGECNNFLVKQIEQIVKEYIIN